MARLDLLRPRAVKTLGIFLVAFTVLGALSSASRAEEPLVRVARVGPWPWISELTGYRARLWFVNSVKFVNHNSADLYSYDPRTGEVRYERHLFSQDAGTPAVVDGLIFWPFEDSRFSAGRAEYMVSNGRQWRWRALPEGTAFHLHAMLRWGNVLLAATSAWRAGLQRSDDLGATWRVIYDHPTERGFVSRITSLALLDGTPYAGLTAWAQDGVKLLRLRDGVVAPVAGWPSGRATRELTPWRGRLYAVNVNDDGGAVWRTDGKRTERVPAFDGLSVRAFTTGPESLWAVTAGESRGTLWQSRDGLDWRKAQSFAGDEPIDVAVYGGRVYVGAKDGDGRGALWGPRPPAPVSPAQGRRSLPAPPPATGSAEIPRLLEALERALSDDGGTGENSVDLRSAMRTLAQSGQPAVGKALARRLEGPFPPGRTSMFGGNLKISKADVARWYMLRAMASTGSGRVPPAFLEAPLTSAPNRAEKYLDVAPGAAFAATLLDQRDRDTLAAMIARLGKGDDPKWLTGDFAGALSALTEKRFGYDVEAWQAWWRQRKRGGD